MPEGGDDREFAALVEAVQKFTHAAERAGEALVKIEALATDLARKQDEDRAEAKARQKKFDQEHEDYLERQKRWDVRDKKWEEQDWWARNPWTHPSTLGNLLLMVAFAALAVAVFRFAVR